MDRAIKRIMLKHRHLCEMPNANGVPLCNNPATDIVEVQGGRWHFNVAVCETCATYARKELKAHDH